MKKPDVLLALEHLCTTLGEDQAVVRIASPAEDGDYFNEVTITQGDIKRELERLYKMEQEVVDNQTLEAIIEECNS
jgi:hypothetical protein